MGQVTHIAQHAAVIGHRLLGRLIRGIERMRAYIREYERENGVGKEPSVVGAVVALVGGDRGQCLLVVVVEVPRIFLLMSSRWRSQLFEKVHALRL